MPWLENIETIVLTPILNFLPSYLGLEVLIMGNILILSLWYIFFSRVFSRVLSFFQPWDDNHSLNNKTGYKW